MLRRNRAASFRMNFLLILLVIFNLHLNNCSGDQDDQPMADIPSLGQVRGSFMTSASGRKFSSFRGIPFAEPPIGKLRFQDPVPADPWKGQILDTTEEGPSCPQVEYLNPSAQSIKGVEDCLKLNIYTHDVKGSKPVMVTIHGGGFNVGSGNGESDMMGPNYLMDRDIVFVTFNYRLGALGFMTTGDGEAPGNYGLLDQSLALKWVRDHIQNFGGDPSSVTIFGISAGGASVEYHLLSPYSKGLFDRAIVQSGSATCPWAISKKDTFEKYSKILAQDFNCPTFPSREMVSCLREKNATDLVDFVQRRGNVVGFLPIAMFGPRIDAERESPFLPDHPHKLLMEKRFNQVPTIAGLTTSEGAYIAAMLLAGDGKGMETLNQDPLKAVSYLMAIEMWEDRNKIAKEVIDYYFDSEKSYENQLAEIVQMISDSNFNKGVDDLSHLLSKYNDQPTFYYEFAHRGQLTVETLVGGPPDFNYGAGHGSDIFLLFSSSLFPPLSARDDIKVSKMLIDLWVSFAIDGVPRSDLLSVEWLPLDSKVESRFLKITADGPTMFNHSMPFKERLAFLNKLFHKSIKDEL